MQDWNILVLKKQNPLQANLSKKYSLQEDRRDHGICRKLKDQKKSRILTEKTQLESKISFFYRSLH